MSSSYLSSMAKRMHAPASILWVCPYDWVGRGAIGAAWAYPAAHGHGEIGRTSTKYTKNSMLGKTSPVKMPGNHTGTCLLCWTDTHLDAFGAISFQLCRVYVSWGSEAGLTPNTRPRRFLASGVQLDEKEHSQR